MIKHVERSDAQALPVRFFRANLDPHALSLTRVAVILISYRAGDHKLGLPSQCFHQAASALAIDLTYMSGGCFTA